MNNDREPRKNFWEDGNGSGTEKADAYFHIGWSAKDNKEFNFRARQPWIKNYNRYDPEPKFHNNGMTVQLDNQNFMGVKKRDYWFHENEESKTADEFHKRAAKPTI